METRFTPGPWSAYEFGADWWVATDSDDSGPMLRVGSIHADREGNANLIAAAPALYEALERIVHTTHYSKDLVGRTANSIAFAALALARGETSHPEHCGGMETSAESGEHGEK